MPSTTRPPDFAAIAGADTKNAVLNGHPEVGFSLRVGGGLSTRPHFGVRLPVFVRWDQVLRVVKGVTEIFRDSACLRENRERARLKFLFL